MCSLPVFEFTLNLHETFAVFLTVALTICPSDIAVLCTLQASWGSAPSRMGTVSVSCPRLLPVALQLADRELLGKGADFTDFVIEAWGRGGLGEHALPPVSILS